MGDRIALVISGLMCQYCGILIDGDEPGYPRSCPVCHEKESDFEIDFD